MIVIIIVSCAELCLKVHLCTHSLLSITARFLTVVCQYDFSLQFDSNLHDIVCLVILALIFSWTSKVISGTAILGFWVLAQGSSDWWFYLNEELWRHDSGLDLIISFSWTEVNAASSSPTGRTAHAHEPRDEHRRWVQVHIGERFLAHSKLELVCIVMTMETGLSLVLKMTRISINDHDHGAEKELANLDTLESAKTFDLHSSMAVIRALSYPLSSSSEEGATEMHPSHMRMRLMHLDMSCSSRGTWARHPA